MPFVLHSQPTAVFEPQKESAAQSAAAAQRRYLEIMRDVEELVNDHSISLPLRMSVSTQLMLSSSPPSGSGYAKLLQVKVAGSHHRDILHTTPFA